MSFELPPQQPLSPEDRGQEEHAAEAAPAAPEQVANRPAQPVLPAIPDDIPAVDQPVIAAPPQDLTPPVPTDPRSVAQDGDHIEPEWLDKTKSVIARTQDDPYLQKDQVSRIKAEYIQKRFNKTIKTDEAAA